MLTSDAMEMWLYVIFGGALLVVATCLVVVLAALFMLRDQSDES